MQRTVMARITRLVCSAVLLLTPAPVAAQSRPIVLKTATVLDGKGQIIRDTTIGRGIENHSPGRPTAGRGKHLRSHRAHGHARLD